MVELNDLEGLLQHKWFYKFLEITDKYTTFMYF